MAKYSRKVDLKWILKAAFWTACVYLVILSGVFLFFSYKDTQNNEVHEELLLKLRKVEDLAYIRNTKDNYGGETPAGAIYMYYEFLESQQYPLASTIFTRETRGEHLLKLKDISEPAMRRFVDVLKAAEKSIINVSPNGERFETVAPIKIGFQKVSGYNGGYVWQLEFIDYQLP